MVFFVTLYTYFYLSCILKLVTGVREKEEEPSSHPWKGGSFCHQETEQEPWVKGQAPHGQEYINQHKYDLSSKLRGVLHPFQKQSFGSKSMSVD